MYLFIYLFILFIYLFCLFICLFIIFIYLFITTTLHTISKIIALVSGLYICGNMFFQLFEGEWGAWVMSYIEMNIMRI